MQIPLRVLVLLRPSVAPGLLLAVGFSTFVLSSTAFLLDLVSDHYDIGLATASLIGVGQLSGFVLGSWGSGRHLEPTRRVFIAAIVLALVANAASIALPPFAILISLRFASGIALGLISWIGWVQVFGEEKGTADLAVMGPLAGIISGPLIAVFATGYGARGVFTLLSILAAIPLIFHRGTEAQQSVPDASERSRPVPAARVLLVALGVFTLGGSAVFQFAVVLGADRVGLSVSTVALVFSANAVVAIPSAKWPWRRGQPGPWMAVTAMCAVTGGLATNAVVFAAAFTIWGFAFWMALPAAFQVLAERSANPADRAGDAQAIMAAGRVVGPFLGGVLFDQFGGPTLGIVGGGLMFAAAVTVFATRTTVQPRSAD